jgi:hypothetical protein
MFPATEVNSAVGPGPLIFLLALAAASGVFLSRLFRATQPENAPDAGVALSFPLVSIGLTALFLTVQFSLPLSLGLLAALSLVRFRTPVKHPEEVGFLAAVVATCVALGAYKVAFAGVTLAAAALVSMAHHLARKRSQARLSGVVEVTLPYEASDDIISDVPHVAGRLGCTLESMSVGSSGTRFAYRFPNLPESAIRELRAEIGRGAPATRVDVWPDRERQL